MTAQVNNRCTHPPHHGMPLSPRESAAWEGFLHAHAALYKAFDAELQARHGLTLSEAEFMVVLSESNDCRMRMAELADAVLLSASGMSRLVERLQRRGLVQREICDSDRRGAYASLTNAGHALVEEVKVTHWDGVRERFLRHFTEQELDLLGGFWNRLTGDTSDSPDPGAATKASGG